MWTTVEQVQQITGKLVTLQTVTQAQAIIESYVGRLETDVSNAGDIERLGYAVSYQAAYMFEDTDKVFEQIATTQTMQFGNMVTFAPDGDSPFIAPLARIACRSLTWKRMRSVKTGSIFARPVVNEDWSRT